MLMKKKTKILLGVTLVAIIAVAGYLIYQRAKPAVYGFEIVSHNGVLRYQVIDPEIAILYNYTITVKVRNVLSDTNGINLRCALTRYDYFVITKNQTVYINKGSEDIVIFFFSNDELQGMPPIHYEVVGERA